MKYIFKHNTYFFFLTCVTLKKNVISDAWKHGFWCTAKSVTGKKTACNSTNQ